MVEQRKTWFVAGYLFNRKKKFGFGSFSLSSSFHKMGQKHSPNWDKRTQTEDE